MADKKQEQPKPAATKPTPAVLPAHPEATEPTKPTETKPAATEAPVAKPAPVQPARTIHRSGPLPHEPSGEVCTLTHHPHESTGDPGGPCVRCKHCKTKVRPHQVKEPCSARARA